MDPHEEMISLNTLNISDPPPYAYTPLHPSHIRVLQITQAEPQLLCNLTQIPLTQDSTFYALSYCWGNGPPTSSITCNNSLLSSSAHLLAGLRCIFASLGPIPLWIDAICINQSDTAEKTSQVARMWNIYSLAKQVVVWLGPSADNSDEAFEAIPQLNRLFAAIPPYTSGIPQSLAKYNLPPKGSPIWHALAHLLSRPWFQRLWIVQEAVLAQDLVVICGTAQLPWSQLTSLSAAVRAYSLTVQWHPDLVEASRTAAILVGNMTRVRESDFVPSALILYLAGSQATKEPLDRAYGILGLLKPEIRAQIEVNYSQEYWVAYTQLFRALLLDEGPKMLIALASDGRHPALPSWCPDLNADYGTTSIPYVGDFACGHGSLRDLGVAVTVAVDNENEMRFQGVKGDTVVGESVPLTDVRHSSVTPAGIPARFLALSAAEARARELVFGSAARFDVPKDVYARTLIANQDWRRRLQRAPYPAERDIAADYEDTFAEVRSYEATGRRPKDAQP